MSQIVPVALAGVSVFCAIASIIIANARLDRRVEALEKEVKSLDIQLRLVRGAYVNDRYGRQA